MSWWHRPDARVCRRPGRSGGGMAKFEWWCQRCKKFPPGAFTPVANPLALVGRCHRISYEVVYQLVVRTYGPPDDLIENISDTPRDETTKHHDPDESPESHPCGQ